MKKHLSILFALLCTAFGAHAQQEITLKFGYNPETKYTQTLKQNMAMEAHFSGTDEMMEQMRQAGVQNPMKYNNESVTETVTTTGELRADGTIPLVLEFANDGALPAKTFIYGYARGGAVVFDSIVSPGMDENLKSMMLQSTQTMLSQMSFPEKTMKVGEEFTMTTPMDFPAAGMQLKIDITMVFKLVSVSDKIADFDIITTIKLDAEKLGTEVNIKAKGTGKGKMKYNLETNFTDSMDNAMDFGIWTSVQGMDINMKCIVSQYTTVDISPAAPKN